MTDEITAALETPVAKEPTKAEMQEQLYAAYDYACQNAADPVAQKAFRQKFQEVRDYLKH